MMRTIKRCYNKIRGKLKEMDADYNDVAKEIGRSRSWVAALMTGKTEPNLTDMYSLLTYLGAEDVELCDYFPRGGKNEN